jgi:outer membrane protein assembly factor BamD
MSAVVGAEVRRGEQGAVGDGMRRVPARTRAWRVLTVAALVCALPGCAAYENLYGKPPRRETRQSDQELVRAAETQMQRGRYEDARKDLQRLMNQYPDSELVAVARLGTAKALYLDKKYDEARTEYQRFLELHPQHDRADEAHYYLGMAYIRGADSPDRDQTATKKGLGELELLIRQMPDSQYVPDARQRIAAARRKLAETEVYVGRFYFDRGHYAAAAGRFERVLADYGAAGLDDQALYFLGESLWRLEQKDQARTAFQRLVHDDPRSEWAPAAANRLGVALVRTGPPKPEGPGLMTRMGDALRETWSEMGETVRSYRIFQ